ncbi:TPA: hypothetical protein UMZ03_001868 [Stenotrophomonas maltophilia]|uniref:hypothetical protein n=1 Tax=Stenotrophomonas maltophilia TaxID=40324 RepID=UPI00066B4096|nr:hypothetical protein [Stenotrophomonas maltophilia]MBH1597456.1 hypothetical protein [Stenotrophomonas maltophilia]MBH1699205.1 hypothetical protein [Stenotrophomonas maltophilia]MBH1711949.1 hypothetical protein [Stenotrophomonas maltophilia]HEL3236824.1 hypothetical protein [Stenotrophomonas maltophilia]HEL3756180.1 hypothetical protein [Stenotrophomonas maltophilia]
MNANTINLADEKRERRIRELAAAMRVARGCGDRSALRRLWSELRASVLARSPEQVRAMEQRMGMQEGSCHG